MSPMYKAAVIGDRESVLGFSALGLTVVPVEGMDQTEEAIRRLANEDYAILYITEQAAQYSQSVIDRYREKKTPAIIPIPSKEGSLGIGMADVRRSVEKAVGADILFND